MSSQIKVLNELAEHETHSVSMSQAVFGEDCKYYKLCAINDRGKFDLNSPLNRICVVDYFLGDRQVKLLFVVPDGGRCDLFPLFELGAGKRRRATSHEAEKFIDTFDGWLIASLIPTSPSGPLLCFSVILKETWRKFGKPPKIDTRLIALTEPPKVSGQ